MTRIVDTMGIMVAVMMAAAGALWIRVGMGGENATMTSSYKPGLPKVIRRKNVGWQLVKRRVSLYTLP